MASTAQTAARNKATGEKWAQWTVVLSLIAIIGLGNLVPILGLKVLLHDDGHCYSSALDGQFPYWKMRFNLMCPFTEWIGWNVLAWSPPLARACYVLFLMVPISYLLYRIYRFKFGFPQTAALVAAAIPQILPHQTEIPAGINMSYPLWGLLISLLAMLVGLRFLEDESAKTWIRLPAAGGLYLIATQTSEQPLFLFPPMAALFWLYGAEPRRRRLLLLTVSAVAISRIIHILILPRVPATHVPFQEIIARSGQYFRLAVPLQGIPSAALIGVTLAIVIMGFVVALRAEGALLVQPATLAHLKRETYVAGVFTVLVTWTVSTVVVFVFGAQWLAPRYTYVSAFGLNALVVLSLSAAVCTPFSRRKVYVALLGILIALSGVQRHFHLKAAYSYVNETRDIIVHDLGEFPFPVGSQIVIAGVEQIPIFWQRTSGTLRYFLKRADVRGLIGPNNAGAYSNFADHFNPRLRGWNDQDAMSGLDPHSPVFLFVLDKGQKRLRQLRYALQWQGSDYRAVWRVLETQETTGKVSKLISGEGYQDYCDALITLRALGIRQSEILWGGPATQPELKRMGLPAIAASNYSDGHDWRNGIHIFRTNLFFFSIAKDETTPLKAGDRLVFGLSGAAQVQTVSRMEQKGRATIFVVVDKPLNPDGDGYPSGIIVGALEDQARGLTGSFTDGACSRTLSNQMATTSQTFTLRSTLKAGPAFRVASPGAVTVRAAVQVVLANGFSVGSGATFAAGLDPSLLP